MAKLVSKGSALKLSIANSYTTIPAIDTLDAPESQPETTDATALDSGVGREHKITGYAEGGQVNATFFYDPAGTVHKALTGLVTAPTHASAWKVVWSDASEWAFTGALNSFGAGARVGELVKGKLGVQLDGLPTYPV